MLQAGFIFSCTIIIYYFLSYINQYLLLFNSIVHWDFFSANIAHMCVSIFSILLSAVFFGRVSGFNFKKALSIKQEQSSALMLCKSALLGVVIVPFVIQINNVFIDIISPILKSTDNSLIATPSTISGLFLLIGTHALYPAFAEELFFRGVLVSPIKDRLSPRWLIVFGAFLYAVSHFSIKLFAAMFILGLILATATHKTKSLLPAMVIHFVYNAVSLVINYLSVDWILLTNFSSWPDYLAFAIKIVASCTLILILLHSYQKQKRIDYIPSQAQPIRMLDFVSFLPGAFLLLMSFMQEISFI